MLSLVGYESRVDRKRAGRGVYELALHVFKGYHWVYNLEPDIWADSHEAPWLIPKATDSHSICYPLEHRDLHRQFARLEGEMEEIAEFANKYGLLEHPVYLREPDKRLKYLEGLIDGEPLARWEIELSHMKELLELWDMVRENERKLEMEVDRRTSKDELGFDWKGRYYEVLRSRDWMPLINLKEEEFRRRLVRYYIVNSINNKLASHCSPRLIEDGEKCDMYIAPDCLLSAMYLLFAEELEGFDPNDDKSHYPKRICKTRGCYKTVDPRTKKHYCDPRCKRHAKYLRRKVREQSKKEA